MNWSDWIINPLQYNSLTTYSQAAAVVLILYVIFHLVDKYLVKKLTKFSTKTKNRFDDIVARTLNELNNFFYFAISLYFGSLFIWLHPVGRRIFNYAVLVIIGFYVIQFLQRLVRYSSEKMIERKKFGNPGLVKFVANLINLTVWLLIGLLILANMGVNITSLVAGLGIGGLAIGLALQNVLTDLFSSVSIYLDEPFQEGDFIIVGDDMGIVKKIGLKTTKITTLRGEELVIPNKNLTETRVRNFNRMRRRRVVLTVGVVYETAIDKLEVIPAWVQEIIDKTEETTFDRAHFAAMNDYSLDFEVVYYVASNDYNLYMDKQQAINLAIMKKFEQEGVDIAFPSQTIYLAKGE